MSVVGLIGWFVFYGLSVGNRSSWQGHAERIVRSTRSAHQEVRRAVAESPKHLRKTLNKAVKESDRLLQRQQELRASADRVGKSLSGMNPRRMRTELRNYAEKEVRESNPRIRAQYAQGRKAVEAQVAHYNAVGDKLRKILEAMREIQGAMEAMQPRIVRLGVHSVDTGSNIEVEDSHEIVEGLDLLIGELESIETEDHLLDMEIINRELERDAQRRVERGEVEPDQDILPPPTITN